MTSPRHEKLLADLVELKLFRIAEVYQEALDEAARKGSSMLDVLATLIAEEVVVRRQKALEGRLRQFTNPQLLLLDELGYLPIDKRGVDLHPLSAPPEPRHPTVDPRGVAGLGDRHFDGPDRPVVDGRTRVVSSGEGWPSARGARGLRLLSSRRYRGAAPRQERLHDGHREPVANAFTLCVAALAMGCSPDAAAPGKPAVPSAAVPPPALSAEEQAEKEPAANGALAAGAATKGPAGFQTPAQLEEAIGKANPGFTGRISVEMGERGIAALAVSDPAIEDIRALEGLPLSKLDLHGCQVSDIRVLEGMALAVLDLSNTGISDISPLKGHPTLERLHIAGSEVTDLAPLQWMDGLTRLIFRPGRIKTGLQQARKMRSIRQIGTSFGLTGRTGGDVSSGSLLGNVRFGPVQLARIVLVERNPFRLQPPSARGPQRRPPRRGGRFPQTVTPLVLQPKRRQCLRSPRAIQAGRRRRLRRLWAVRRAAFHRPLEPRRSLPGS
jgi:hypothetical protein